MRFHLLLCVALPAIYAQNAPKSIVHFERGPVNAVIVGTSAAVYSPGKAANRVHQLFLTHARRNAYGQIPAGAQVTVPSGELEMFTGTAKFWNGVEAHQFHDYEQKSTKAPVVSIANAHPATDGQVLSLEGARVAVVSTPGYTPGAVSYLIEDGARRIVCTGDLIYGDGQILDLFSLQDAVPEAKARGYHGYAARAGALIASLRKIDVLNPDVLYPAHGPAIEHPHQSIAKLIDRLQRILQSHFETDALLWYWGQDNHRIRSTAVGRPMDVMPMADQAKLPPEIVAIGNSRLILSATGAAFLVDAGYRKTLPELQRMRSQGIIRSVDGLWVTHYHDDHTDYINDVVKEFGMPVYFSDAMTKVMANPAGFRLPCLTNRAVPTQDAKTDGQTLRWHEWLFTFWNFPGQTLYHGGLVAKRDSGETYLFVGDSFTPSGMDDYCMQNRDYLRAGTGFDYCLNRIASLPADTWLINQHVEPMFRYNGAQMNRMKAELVMRSSVLTELSPWPDINYMVDESWSRIYPYMQEERTGNTVSLSVQITNHAPIPTAYSVRWNVPSGWKLASSPVTVTIPPRADGSIEAKFHASGPGLHVITADVSFGPWELKSWTEALVRIK